MKDIADVVDDNVEVQKLAEESKALKETIYKLRE